MKRIVIKRAPGGSTQAEIQSSGFNVAPGVYGLWGKVIARHSEDHTVDIRTDRKFVLERVPVASREWITESDPPTGARDLPPEGTYVFMLMPTGQVESGFIIASVFPQTLGAMKADFLKKDKETEAFMRIEGGWQKTYDKSQGNTTIDDDNGFTLTVKKSEKKVTITDWSGNTITIDENGIFVQDTNENKATADKDGIIIEDKNGNIVTTNEDGIAIQDKTGNKVEMKTGGLTITTLDGKITGGMLNVGGVVTPKGSGPFCAISFCPITGLPHCGDTVIGT
jgi:hypothetical protein